MIATDVHEFIDELDAGVLKDKIAAALSEVAMATVMHGGKGTKGKLSIELNFTKVGDHDQVFISHKISTDRPTKRGRSIEHDTTETAMFVGPGGRMSITAPKVDENGQFQLESVKDGA
jgi:hypothetical protein